MRLRRKFLAVVAMVCWNCVSTVDAAVPQTGRAKVEAALTNITTLERPGQMGLATVWDGNKYVQCRPLPDHATRCEAAGSRLQPSLKHMLTREKIGRLATLGWDMDSAFGNYVQIFAPATPTGQIADHILQTLGEAYEADVSNLEVQTDWIRKEDCPPRNGPRQNLAGLISDAPAMADTAIHACSYAATPDTPAPAESATGLVDRYGKDATGEIQRLTVNSTKQVFAIFNTAVGYIQCQPVIAPPSVYCEAASADSWPVLAGVLTPERVGRLHAAGYADPGRSPNFSKAYALSSTDEAAIGREILTLLFDVYGYTGVPKLSILTEKSH